MKVLHVPVHINIRDVIVFVHMLDVVASQVCINFEILEENVKIITFKLDIILKKVMMTNGLYFSYIFFP